MPARLSIHPSSENLPRDIRLSLRQTVCQNFRHPPPAAQNRLLTFPLPSPPGSTERFGSRCRFLRGSLGFVLPQSEPKPWSRERLARYMSPRTRAGPVTHIRSSRVTGTRRPGRGRGPSRPLHDAGDDPVVAFPSISGLVAPILRPLYPPAAHPPRSYPRAPAPEPAHHPIRPPTQLPTFVSTSRRGLSAPRNSGLLCTQLRLPHAFVAVAPDPHSKDFESLREPSRLILRTFS